MKEKVEIRENGDLSSKESCFRHHFRNLRRKDTAHKEKVEVWDTGDEVKEKVEIWEHRDLRRISQRKGRDLGT